MKLWDIFKKWKKAKSEQEVSNYKWDRNTPVLVMDITSCAYMMFANEVNYLREIGKLEMVFDKERTGDYVLERISFITSFLSLNKIQMKDEWIRMWLEAVVANLKTSKRITPERVKSLLDERLRFYSTEIDVLRGALFPTPNAIISQLYEPMTERKLSHKISIQNQFILHENLILWEIITREVNKLVEKIEINKATLC